MAAFARLFVLLLTAVMGLSPWAGTRELRREPASEGIGEHVSRPDGGSVAINRSEKHRGLHRQRIATSSLDPVSGTGDDDLVAFEGLLFGDAEYVATAPRLELTSTEHRARAVVGAHSCRGPPAVA